MLGAHGMVMRECRAMIDERLLRSAFDTKVLLDLASRLLLESESKVDTRATLIGVADMASRKRRYTALANLSSQRAHRAFIKRNDIAPHRGSFAHISRDVAIEQEIADVRKNIFRGLERFSGLRAEVDCIGFSIDRFNLLLHSENVCSIAFHSRQQQTHPWKRDALHA